MLKIYIAIGVGAVIAWSSYDYGVTRTENKNKKAVIIAIQQAVKEEREKQEKINHELRNQKSRLDAINSRLQSDLDGLRKRHSRETLSESARSACQGTTGAELSGPDSRFLARLAARADRIRSALETCYNYVDTVTKKAP